jgi:hypothetical protein
LSDEEKEIAFAELVEEVIRVHGGNCTIPIAKPNRELLGYLVPIAAAEAQLRTVLPKLTPEQVERSQRALKDLSQTFDVNEFFDELSREDKEAGSS